MSESKFGAARVKVGECTCGQAYIVIGDNKLADTMKEGQSDAKPKDVDIFACDGSVARCSGCGKEIELPAAEVFDVDRTDIGQRRQVWFRDTEPA